MERKMMKQFTITDESTKGVTKDNSCFNPEKNMCYPLCVGRNLEKCKNCQLRADWEPDDPYGVEK